MCGLTHSSSSPSECQAEHWNWNCFRNSEKKKIEIFQTQQPTYTIIIKHHRTMSELNWILNPSWKYKLAFSVMFHCVSTINSWIMRSSSWVELKCIEVEADEHADDVNEDWVERECCHGMHDKNSQSRVIRGKIIEILINLISRFAFSRLLLIISSLSSSALARCMS